MQAVVKETKAHQQKFNAILLEPVYYSAGILPAGQPINVEPSTGRTILRDTFGSVLDILYLDYSEWMPL